MDDYDADSAGEGEDVGFDVSVVRGLTQQRAPARARTLMRVCLDACRAHAYAWRYRPWLTQCMLQPHVALSFRVNLAVVNSYT